MTSAKNGAFSRLATVSHNLHLRHFLPVVRPVYIWGSAQNTVLSFLSSAFSGDILRQRLEPNSRPAGNGSCSSARSDQTGDGLSANLQRFNWRENCPTGHWEKRGNSIGLATVDSASWSHKHALFCFDHLLWSRCLIYVVCLTMLTFFSKCKFYLFSTVCEIFVFL